MTAGAPVPGAVEAALKLDWTRISKELGLPSDRPFTIQIIQPSNPNEPLTLITRPAPDAPAATLGSDGNDSESSATQSSSGTPDSGSETTSTLAAADAAPSTSAASAPQKPRFVLGTAQLASHPRIPLPPPAPPSGGFRKAHVPVPLLDRWDGTVARTRPFIRPAKAQPPSLGDKRRALQTGLTGTTAPKRGPLVSLPPPQPAEAEALPGAARTRPFAKGSGSTMRTIQALFPARTTSQSLHSGLLRFASKSPAKLGVPLSRPLDDDRRRERKQQFPPRSPQQSERPEHMKKMGFLKSTLTCARVRPVGGKSFSSARVRPFNGLRKETNWFYFMIHPQRKGRYISRAAKRLRTDELSGRSGKNVVMSTEIPLPLQYRGYLQRPPHLFLSNGENWADRRSQIHRVGVFADEDLICGRLVLEYRGQIHRWSLCDRREDRYKAQGLGSYMFRLDDPSRGEGQVPTCLDATRCGSIARFINHSCDPNCAAKTITFEEQRKIVLFTTRNVEKGEELSYNYNMPYEDEKIPCFCGARNCKKTLN